MIEANLVQTLHLLLDFHIKIAPSFYYSLGTNLNVPFAWARLLRMVWGPLKRVNSKG